MKPITFPEVTGTWAKDQPPYLPLPAYTDKKQTITCWQLTWRERLRVLLSGRLWLSQLNFGGPLQPQRPSVESPFSDHPVGEPTAALIAASKDHPAIYRDGHRLTTKPPPGPPNPPPRPNNQRDFG